MLRKLRMIIGILVICSLTLFFLNVINSLGILVRIQFISALFAANILSIVFLGVCAFLFGRIYCSALCPLGIMQDIVIWLSRKVNKNKKRFRYSPEWTKLRYTILLVMVVTFFIGVASVTAILDPYSIYGRIVTHLLSPVWYGINNLLAIVSDRYEMYFFTKKTIYLQSIEALILSVISLIVISFMAWKHGRLYCNTICPVGTIFGTMSRFSVWKISANVDKCNHCGLCASKCKSSCIDSEMQKIDYSRCINCFDCIEACPKKALSFKPGFLIKKINSTTNAAGESNTAVSRRQFITTSAISMMGTIAVMKKVAASPSEKHVDGISPVLPPGAKSHDDFSTHCTSCHLCVSKCPNEVLKPLPLAYGIGTVMQPAMDFKNGYCDYDCNICGMICPNHAIKKLSLEQKQNTKIGYAVFDLGQCVVETDEVNCGNCAIHCPTKAIRMVDYKNRKIPSIDLSLCIGCGSCEYHCPANSRAIHVVGFTEHK